MNEGKLVAVTFNPNGDGVVCTHELNGLVNIRQEGKTTFWSIFGKKHLGEWKIGENRKHTSVLSEDEVIVVIRSAEKLAVLQALADAVFRTGEV